jgi:energy-coupling factor transporter ATP-binding protein EcfA2
MYVCVGQFLRHIMTATRSTKRANSHGGSASMVAPQPPAGGIARETKLLLDVPAECPALRFSAIAKGLCQVIMTNNPRFAVAIFGSWGSGKTTLMQAIQNAIEHDIGDQEVVCVQFSAWRYEKERDLIVPLLDSVREALVDWSNAHDRDKHARAAASALGRVTRSLVAGLIVQGGVPGLNFSFDAGRSIIENRRIRNADATLPRSSYYASFQELKRTFKAFAASGGGARRIVVFVDDLDRCLPENAARVLESMKLFFDLDGFVFIAGLDKDVVEHAIDTKYRWDPETAQNASPRSPRISGAEYLAKIFQLPYFLEPVAVDQIESFLDAACNESGLLDTQRIELKDRVEPHLRYLVGDSNVNPRQIKRYINCYTTKMAVSLETLDPDVLLTIQTMEFRSDWQHAFRALLDFREEFLHHLRHRAVEHGAATRPLYLDEELQPPLPHDLLDYVTRDAPGYPLVLTGNIEPYLDSASRSPAVLEAIMLVGEVRTLLANAGHGMLDPQSLRSELLTRLAKVTTFLEASPAVGSDFAALADFRGRVCDTLGTSEMLGISEITVDRSAEDDDLSSGPTMDESLAALGQSARELSDRLRRLYRAGELRRASSQLAAASEDDGGPGKKWQPGEAGTQGENAVLDERSRKISRDLEGAEAAFSPAAENGDGSAANDLEELVAQRGQSINLGTELLRFGAEDVPGVVEYVKEMAVSQTARRHDLRLRLQERILGWASQDERRVTLSYAEQGRGDREEARIVLRAEPGCPGWGGTCPPTIDASTAWGRSVLNLVASETPRIRICRSRCELEETPGYEETARDPARFPAYALIPMVAKHEAVTIGTLEVESKYKLWEADAAELITMASVLACAKMLDTAADPKEADTHA